MDDEFNADICGAGTVGHARPLNDAEVVMGQRVEHCRDLGVAGTVLAVDDEHCTLGATTCQVHWDDTDSGVVDVQWTNRLVPSHG